MKPRFRAKEFLVLLPALGFVGLAFYWTRAERLGSAPSPRVATRALVKPPPAVVKAVLSTRTCTLPVLLTPRQTVRVMSPPVGPTGARMTTRHDRELLFLVRRKAGITKAGRPALSIDNCRLVPGGFTTTRSRCFSCCQEKERAPVCHPTRT